MTLAHKFWLAHSDVHQTDPAPAHNSHNVSHKVNCKAKQRRSEAGRTRHDATQARSKAKEARNVC